MFGLKSLVFISVRHSWRTSTSVALGVATATAVIVGALLVGDSMRGSLRQLTIERLGKTDSMVAPMRFFDPKSIAPDNALPVLFFPTGIAEFKPQGSSAIRRAGSVQLIGCDDSFWNLDVAGVRPNVMPTDDSIVLNESAATELGVKIGDLVTIRLPVEQAVPADSPLGRRDIQSEGLPRMKVVDIIPDRGLGRFSINASQAAPLNVYLNRSTVAEVLDRPEQANILLFDHPVNEADFDITLESLGLTLKRVRSVDPKTKGDAIIDYYSLTSDQLLLPEVVVDETSALLGDRATKLLTYLANAIERVDASGKVIASVPYSTLTSIPSTPALPLNYGRPETDREIVSDEIPLVINSWTAERLDAKIGTELRIAYYEPEVENGNEIERSFKAIVTDVVPVTRPAKPYRRSREAVFENSPTVYNDPDLTPTVPGVTDQDSISDWDLPFKLTREISSEDDRYWNEFRLTPKAFIPLETGEQLFGSRFGKTTGLRIKVVDGESEEMLGKKILSVLDAKRTELGWSVHHLRDQQLTASRGTTPFDGLFLALSFFVILAAVMLIAMLFRLGLTQRLRQFGTLLAIGWTPRRVGQWVLGEGAFIATVGVTLGILAGVGYAMLVLWALRSWWVGAVTVPFLTFHWTMKSLLIGAITSWLVALLTLAMTIRSIVRVDAQTLLVGKDEDQSIARQAITGGQSRLKWIAIAIGLIAIVIAGAGASAGGQSAAGGFVGGGMLLLVAVLMTVYDRLKRPRKIEKSIHTNSFNTTTLAIRNASRNPLRSTLTIGLMATAAFLIIAITAFQLRPTEKGTGGFDLVAQTSQPFYRDLADPKIRSEILGPDTTFLSSSLVAPMRMRLGQDASCNNLYQATNPTVLGVPESFGKLLQMNESELPGFDWANHATLAEGQTAWELLATKASGTADDPIPVVIDLNTAMWSLQMQKGIGETKAFEFEAGKLVYLKVVGLLSNTLLQGKLLIGEANFQRAFPNISGYRFFLIESHSDSEKVASVLENRLGDVGFDVSQTDAVLSSMMAVQNTYLRTFQSLGTLGLLLGTVGLAISQVRSVLQRRSELAVMRAIGFTRERLSGLVMKETAILLLVGIGCGAVCAILAVLPYGMLSGIRPPWIEPLLIVLGIVIFGLLAGLFAVRQISKMPLLESLRSE